MATKTTLFRTDIGLYNPLQDGSSLNETTLSSAEGNRGSSEWLYITNGTWSITSNLDLSAGPVYVPFGSKFSINSSVTLTLGAVIAGNYEIFTGSGNVTISETLVHNSWFGNSGTNTISTSYLDIGNGSSQLFIDGSGNIGFGTSTPNNSLHRHVASASAASLQFTNSLTGEASPTAGCRIGLNANADMELYAASDILFRANGTTGSMSLTSYQLVISTLPLTKSSSFLSYGICIDEGSAGDELICLKGNNVVAHGMTDIADTTTFGTARMTPGSSGGLRLSGFSETFAALQLVGYGATEETTKTVSGSAHVQTLAFTKSGTGAGGPGANTNIFAVAGAAGSGSTKFIVDIEGDLFADGGTTSTDMVTKYDKYDDVGLIRMFDLLTGNPETLIANEWDKFIRYNEETLVELGILGAPLKDRPLYCVTKLQKLQNGAICQLYTALLEERTARLEVHQSLIEERQERLKLEQRIRLLEAA